MTNDNFSKASDLARKAFTKGEQAIKGKTDYYDHLFLELNYSPLDFLSPEKKKGKPNYSTSTKDQYNRFVTWAANGLNKTDQKLYLMSKEEAKGLTKDQKAKRRAAIQKVGVFMTSTVAGLTTRIKQAYKDQGKVWIDPRVTIKGNDQIFIEKIESLSNWLTTKGDQGIPNTDVTCDIVKAKENIQKLLQIASNPVTE